MVRLSATENGAGRAFQDSELTFMVGMIAASISMMAIVIFACAKSSTKRKNKNNPYTGGDKTFAKTVVIGESKAQKTRATSAPIRSAGEKLVISTAEISVDIPATDDVCDNNNNNGGNDTRCHGGGDDGSKNNDVSSGNNHTIINSNHTHASTEITSGGGGHHHDYTSTGNTGGGGGWSSDHGGSSWSGGDHGGGGFSGGGGDTGGFSGGGW